MAIDSTIAIRRGLIRLMKINLALTDIVPAARIYPQTVPAGVGWPFIKTGAPSLVPLRATCVDGGEVDVAIHGFAMKRLVGGVEVETAEDHAGRIGAAIAGALDRQIIPLDTGTATIRWRGAQLLMDPEEADAFHAVQQFRVRAITS